jgi:hypothetical protein
VGGFIHKLPGVEHSRQHSLDAQGSSVSSHTCGFNTHYSIYRGFNAHYSVKRGFNAHIEGVVSQLAHLWGVWDDVGGVGWLWRGINVFFFGVFFFICTYFVLRYLRSSVQVAEV